MYLLILISLLFLIVANLISLYVSLPIVNEVAQAKVRIDGYQIYESNGILQGITENGTLVHLIDEGCKFSQECVLSGGKEVRIRFRVGIIPGIIIRIRLFLGGLDH